MARQVGDLWPAMSGTSSLGAEQIGENGGFSEEIRPFAHVHLNSGVFHDATGQSGIIRLNQEASTFEQSLDGGVTFSPLGGGADDSLNSAYENGRYISLDKIASKHEGIIIESAAGADGFFGVNVFNGVSGPDLSPMLLLSGVAPGSATGAYRKAAFGLYNNGYAIRASGTPTTDPCFFSLSANGTFLSAVSSGLYVASHAGDYVVSVSNGSVSLEGSNAFLTGSNQTQLTAFGNSGLLSYQFGPYEAWHTTNGAGDTTLIPIPHSGHVEQMINGRFNDQDVVTLTTSLTTNINAAATNNLISWDTQSLVQGDSISHSTTTNSSRLTANETGIYYISATLSFTSTQQRYNGRIKIRVNGTTVLGVRGKSGYIRALSGHNEASLQLTNYAIQLNAGDYIEVLVDRESTLTGPATLVANESYITMIRGNVAAGNDLQTAYENGDTIILNSNSDLEVWSANSSSFKLVATDNNPAINFSGVARASTNSQERGNLDLLYHGDVASTGQPTLETAQARALGLATFALNTGSGIANVSVGSGIQRWRQSGSSTIAAFPTFTVIGLSNQISENDVYYTYDASSTGIRILSPGLYLVTGSIQFQSAGVTTSVVSQLTVNGTSQAGTAGSALIIAGGFSSTYPNGLLNLKANDIIRLQASKLSAAGTIQTTANETSLNLVYLGPPRGGTA